MHLMPLGGTAKELDLHFLGAHLQPQVAQGAHGAVLWCVAGLCCDAIVKCLLFRRRVLVLAPRRLLGV